MKVIRTEADWKPIWTAIFKENKQLGFVPTMGALHQGHLDLVAKSIESMDFTVVSIFVNPTQFNSSEDFQKYPQTLEADLALLESAGVDFVFVPTVASLYPQPSHLRFDFGSLEQVLEGEFRPGHFNGVGLVVAKLFHLIQPTRAFFGQKDLQQVAIIKRLVQDLSFGLSIEVVPTRREKDGLAMSSRNMRLNPEERQQALLLAGGGQQHDDADIGAWKMLHQARQELDLVVGQGRGVMHDPNFGVGYPGGGVSGRIYRGADQHVVKTR
jgi:pantoate--beta-alanine ligase